MKWTLFFVGWGVVVLFIILVALGSRPLTGEAQTVEIAPGTSRVVIAKQLQQQKLVRSRLSFLTVLALMGGTIQAGTYTLDPKQNIGVLVRSLQSSQNQFVTITIPEGWRKEQIAQELTKKGLPGMTFLQAAVEKEGFLFPDTYFFRPDATIDQILAKFQENYTNRTKDLQLTREQLILASIVEREAKSDDERALISGIYSNRLKIGMALEADPTVQYAKETNLLAADIPVTQFWQPITVADYHSVNSKYNTYLFPGLPPSPIANPGIKSMTAAVHPATTDAHFFFHTSDGKIIPSRTLQEHNQNKQKYL